MLVKNGIITTQDKKIINNDNKSVDRNSNRM